MNLFALFSRCPKPDLALTFINVDEVELPPKGSSQPKDDYSDIGREVDGDIPF